MCEYDQHGQRLGGAAGFVDDLVTALVNRRIYAPHHPRVQATIAELVARLDEHFAGGAAEHSLGIAEGYLVFEQRPLLGATLSAPRLIHAIEQLGGGGVRFAAGAGQADVCALLDVLCERAGAARDVAEANLALAHRGGARVQLLPPYGGGAPLRGSVPSLRQANGGGPAAATAAVAVDIPIALYQGVVDTLQGITIDVCRGHAFTLDVARGQLEKVLQRLDADPKAIMNLSRYEHYDAFTFGHSIRVAFLAMTFARALTSEEEVLNRIGMAGLLHDVGKARIPFEILQSRRRLTPPERAEMEGHTVHGGAILLELADSDPWAVTTAFGHHRTVLGKGYPRTVPEARLSTVTKLVKICDVYEALTAVRPYKAGMSAIRAYRIMMSMREHFDPGLLRLFIQTNGIYPVGTQVQLSTGHLARVEHQTVDPQRPAVSLETSPEGEPLHEEDRVLLDLSQQYAGARQVEVVRGLSGPASKLAL